jgi:hypothetical protein
MAVGGGITRIYSSEYPSPLNIMLALLIELPLPDLGVPHDIEVNITGSDEPIGGAQGGFLIGGTPDLETGELLVAPIVLDLRPVVVPAEGSYSMHISLDGEFRQTLSFVARPPV